jgi:hypothetical protein
MAPCSARIAAAQVEEDLVAEGFVYGANDRAPGLGEGAEALGHLPAALLGPPPPDVELCRAVVLRQLRRVAVRDESLGERAPSSRDRREGVGLGVETGDKHSHNGDSCFGTKSRHNDNEPALRPRPDGIAT